MKPNARFIARGFTLIEMLVVVAIIGFLAAILLTALHRVRMLSNSTACTSNLRQLGLANSSFAADHRTFFVMAAEDIHLNFGGSQRWHGKRVATSVTESVQDNIFDPAQGPLSPYFGASGRVKTCPTFIDFTQKGADNAFEAGTGGYGYNHVYIGGRQDLFGTRPEAAMRSASQADVKNPAQTVMFADAAFTSRSGANIEYSFLEPPYIQQNPGPPSNRRTKPSAHFRHDGELNLVWVDLSVASKPLAFNPLSLRRQKSPSPADDYGLGWFGPDDNSLFDLH